MRIIFSRTTIWLILFLTQFLINMKILGVIKLPWAIIFIPAILWIVIVVFLVAIALYELANMPDTNVDE